ncbi:uncharacterized protein LOC114536851 [Dendronephthya gigantea]|uniref:uncharacterized protein LOC114536851 n=1 Tax=Dendronephthya gigantea TaxID=151771 RepID=UPI001069EC6F|nr:uncharacterized protein LOC114536851 [Dendronephthya gigantea]
MASEGESSQRPENDTRNESRTTLFRYARLYNSRKSLFNSPFSNTSKDSESDQWVKKCNSFQVDMQVDTILSSSQQEAHQQRLEKLRQELDYIKTDAWKYKPIEDLIGF